MDVELFVRRCRGWHSGLSAATLIVGITVATVAVTTASAATVDTSAWYVLVKRHSAKALDVYNLATNDGAILLQEAIGSDGRRGYRSFTSSTLSGSWTPQLASESNPFSRSNNVTFSGAAWTRGQDPNAGGDYIRLPWRTGLLSQANSTC